MTRRHHLTLTSMAIGALLLGASPASAITRWLHQPPAFAQIGEDLHLLVAPPADCAGGSPKRLGCTATRTFVEVPAQNATTRTVAALTVDAVPTLVVVPGEELHHGVFHYRLRTWEQHCQPSPDVGGPFPGFRLGANCRWVAGPVLPNDQGWYAVRVGTPLLEDPQRGGHLR